MAVYGSDRRRFIIESIIGSPDQALHIISQAKARSHVPAGDFERAVFAYRPEFARRQDLNPPERNFLSKPIFDKTDPEHVRLKFSQLPDEPLSEKDIEKLCQEIDELSAECAKQSIYTALIEVPEQGNLPAGIASKLVALAERGIEYQTYCGADKFKSALEVVAKVECPEFADNKYFKVSQRPGRYLPSIYIVEPREDFSSESYSADRWSVLRELRTISAMLRGEQVLLFVPQNDFPALAAKSFQRSVEKQGGDGFIYFAGKIDASLKMNPNFRNYYTSYLEAISDLQLAVGMPHIAAPKKGWSSLNPPRYMQDQEYFAVPGFISLGDLNFDDLRSDLVALAESADKKICLDLRGRNLSRFAAEQLRQLLGISCDERGGCLVVCVSDSAENRNAFNGSTLSIVNDWSEAQNLLRLHYPVNSPTGGFNILTKPRIIEAYPKLLISGLQPAVISNSLFLGSPNVLTSEVKHVLDSKADGLVLDLSTTGMSNYTFRDLVKLAQHAYNKWLAVVTARPGQALEFRHHSANKAILVHKSLSEAMLEIEYGIAAPQDGWRFFSLDLVEDDGPYIVAKPPNADFTKSLLQVNKTGMLELEFAYLSQNELPVILDLSGVKYAFNSFALQAVKAMQAKITGAKGRFALVTEDSVQFSANGVNNVYPTLESASLDFIRFPRYPLGFS